MPKKVMPLNELQIKNAKAKKADYTLTDGGGLAILIKANGSKLWRFRYTINSNRYLTSFGTYPTVSLAEAREKRAVYQKEITNGINPAEKKRETAEKAKLEQNDTFREIALEWMERVKGQITEPYRLKKIRSLEIDIFPYIGNRRINTIKPLEFLELIKKIQERGVLETSHRVFNLCSNIWSYAVTIGRAERNITIDINKRFALKQPENNNFPTITNTKKIKGLLDSIDNYDGDFRVMCALQLASLTAQRPFNVRAAEWKEIDFKNKLWKIPADKMKVKMAHIVPLSNQAIKIIKAIEPLTADGKYLFPSIRTTARPISDNTLNAALRRLGYTKDEIVAHGFRAMFSTLAHEEGKRTEIIEKCLAHAENNKVKAAYNHAEYLEERKELMQWWADYLDNIKNS